MAGIPYRVDPSSVLLLNRGTCYSSRIAASRSPVEVFALFFDDQIRERLQHSLSRKSSVENLRTPRTLDGMLETLYRPRRALAQRLQQMRRTIAERQDHPLWLESQLRAVLVELLRAQQDVLLAANRLSAARTATRIEQYRRLVRARDQIDSDLGSPQTLDTLSRVACLSPFHLQRLFKEAFGVTPRRYLVERRMQVAQELLAQSTLAIAEIGEQVGFSSPSSFTQFVVREVGLPPRALREQLRSKTTFARGRPTAPSGHGASDRG